MPPPITTHTPAGERARAPSRKGRRGAPTPAPWADYRYAQPKRGQQLPHLRAPEVLVVDDDEAVGVLIAYILAEKYATTSVESVAEARAALEAAPHRFALILTDLTMPEESGAELVAWVRRCHPHLLDRIGVITGGANNDEDEAFLACKERPCLRKPFGPSELRGFVASLAAETQVLRHAAVP